MWIALCCSVLMFLRVVHLGMPCFACKIHCGVDIPGGMERPKPEEADGIAEGWLWKGLLDWLRMVEDPKLWEGAEALTDLTERLDFFPF